MTEMKAFDIITQSGYKAGKLIFTDDSIEARWNYGGIMWHWLTKKKGEETAKIWADIHLCDRCANILDCKQPFFGGYPISSCDSHEWSEQEDLEVKQ